MKYENKSALEKKQKNIGGVTFEFVERSKRSMKTEKKTSLFNFQHSAMAKDAKQTKVAKMAL